MRKRLFEILQPAADNDTPSKVFDWVLALLIITCSCIAIVGTFDIPDNVRDALDLMESIVVVLFTVEYICRICTANYLYPELSYPKAIIRYMFSFMGLIDLVSILPWWLSGLLPYNMMTIRLLRIIRMLKIFKLGSYMDGLIAVGDTFRAKRHELISSVAVILILMVVSAVLMYGIETDAQPDAFANAAQALWWAVCALTTVGYGDVYPITIAGKALAAIISVLGIGLVAVPSGIVSAGFIEQMQAKQKENDATHYCPGCGRKLD